VNPTAAGRSATIMGRALAARACDLEAAFAARPGPTREDRIDLTRPAPTPIPDHVAAAARDALDRGETHYTSRPGVPELRQGIARRLTADGFPATAESVVVTNGGTEGLYIALQALARPGSTIAAPEPTPPHVREMIRFMGAEAISIPTDAANRFTAPAATALLLMSPSPVSGVAIADAALIDLVEDALARDTAVVIDRSWATALYDPALARFSQPDLGARVSTIGSFSTGHGLGGWRVGFVSTPPDRVKPVQALKQAMSICTTAVSQYAALAALEGPTDWLTERREMFARRRVRAIAALGQIGLPTIRPDSWPALLIDARALDPDDRRLAARLAERAGVIVEPGSAFGPATAGFIRIDLAVDDALLAAGLARIAEAIPEVSAA
jgi:aspartate/methionine/tyrosine aminotransferase